MSFGNQELFEAVPLNIWTSLVAQMVKNQPATQRPRFNPWARKIPWRRKWQLTPVFLLGEFHGQRILGATVHGVATSQT